MTEDDGSRRLELVRTAQQQWIEALTDLGGRNTLLYYKDRRAGTLDLAHADPEALDRFAQSGSIRLTRLFKDADLRADAIRRVQAIHRKARELLEERGIRAGYLATGMARWDELFLEPAAPVLLRGLTVAPTRARYDDFELILDDEEEVNPVLLHKLTSVFGAELDGLTPQDAAGRLVAAEHPAREDSDAPEDDYSVLDADSSQRHAIDTVLAGQSLVIHGPPGTGKSQTIANLIAALVAHGRKVLFVAEKRAAIDAVLSRLKGV